MHGNGLGESVLKGLLRHPFLLLISIFALGVCLSSRAEDSGHDVNSKSRDVDTTLPYANVYNRLRVPRELTYSAFVALVEPLAAAVKHKPTSAEEQQKQVRAADDLVTFLVNQGIFTTYYVGYDASASNAGQDFIERTKKMALELKLEPANDSANSTLIIEAIIEKARAAREGQSPPRPLPGGNDPSPIRPNDNGPSPVRETGDRPSPFRNRGDQPSPPRPNNNGLPFPPQPNQNNNNNPNLNPPNRNNNNNRQQDKPENQNKNPDNKDKDPEDKNPNQKQRPPFQPSDAKLNLNINGPQRSPMPELPPLEPLRVSPPEPYVSLLPLVANRIQEIYGEPNPYAFAGLDEELKAFRNQLSAINSVPLPNLRGGQFIPPPNIGTAATKKDPSMGGDDFGSAE